MKIILKYLQVIIFMSILFSCATVETPEPEETPQKNIIVETKDEPEEIEVIKEENSNTLNETEIKEAEINISELIQQLNEIIESKDFESWKNYLSEDYINYYSNTDVLKEKTQSPLLTKYKIVLRSLEDYFNFVVVGSRHNIKLDEIKALDRDHIKAYMFINNKAVIIYELIRIDNNWKIGKFLE